MSFDRLIKQVDQLALTIAQKFIIQKGFSPYVPKNADYFDFESRENMLELINSAEIVITHAGFGIMGDCIKSHKRIIVVPREKKYNESVNPQLELAEYLATTTTGIICVREVDQLRTAIIQALKITPNYQFTNNIPQLIQNFIDRKMGLTKHD